MTHHRLTKRDLAKLARIEQDLLAMMPEKQCPDADYTREQLQKARLAVRTILKRQAPEVVA